MKPQTLSIGACVASLGLAVLMSPAVAGGVSQAQRTACERAAERVLPALRPKEKEAWIALLGGCDGRVSAKEGSQLLEGLRRDPANPQASIVLRLTRA